MKKTGKQKKILFLSRLLYSSFCFVAILSCTSITKTPLHSNNLIFKIRWDYSSPFQKKQSSFSSLVFVQGEDMLRLDILQTFVGVMGSLILNGKTMILQVPLKKQYYKGEFNSQVFFPEFPSFPSSWLRILLRGQASKNWNCQKQHKKITQCQADDFEISWKYKKSQLYEIRLKDSKQRQIKAQIQNLYSEELSSSIFEPSLKKWKRQKDPLFFQAL